MCQEITASAPAKLILCGEHAVVYERPAIAIPVHGVRARVSITAAQTGSGILIHAPDLGRSWRPDILADDPLSLLIISLIERFNAIQRQASQALLPDLLISISSEIPIASGMGSGAAIATALVRGLAAYYGQQLSPAEVSMLVYTSEQAYHGTPSGIDNTVVAYEQPICFTRRPAGQVPLIEPITIRQPLHLLIADTGIRSATKLPVGEVRRRWQADPEHYEALFNTIGALALEVRASLEGNGPSLGPLLNHNQQLLQQLGVSSPELDQLVDVALKAGALGAKLSGAGWGGVMIVLIAPEQCAIIRAALLSAGAVRVFVTTLGGGAGG